MSNVRISTPALDQVHNATGAIVLGGRVNGVAVIRSLGSMGVQCGGVFVNANDEYASRSKYLAWYETVAEDANDRQMLRAITTVADRLPDLPQVLIPTTDRFSQLLCENAATLSKRFVFNCANSKLYDQFLDKWQTASICREHSVLTPATECPSDLASLREVSSKLRFPLIIKPRYTFDSSFPGKNVQVENLNDLEDFFLANDLLGKAVVQEIIPSGDGDIIVLASYSNCNGEVAAMYSGRKIRQFPPDYGVTCFGISERHPELERSTRFFLDAIGYRGFAMIEFALSRSDGCAYFLELNTRMSWTNRLFADAGVDLSKIGYLDITGQDYTALFGPVSQRDGIVWLDFRRDLASMRIKRRSMQIGFLDWLSSLFRARSFAYWSWTDPAPFFTACFCRARQLTRRLLSRRDVSP